VFLTDIQNRFTNADGSASEATRHAGDVIWAESVRHANTILSRRPVEMIELELKHRVLRSAEPGSTTSLGGAQERVLFENESVRVLRASVSEHGLLSPHVHRKSVIITVQSSTSGGQVVQHNPASAAAIPKATVEWAEVAPHRIPDARTGPLVVVVIELKDF
jgi:hypothetical protein